MNQHDANTMNECGQTVLVLCVNYHSDHEVVAFVESLKAQRCTCRLVTVVIDNSSGEDGSCYLEKSLQEFSNVYYVSAGGNLGYFGGARVGFEWFVRRFGIPTWTILSNADIEMPCNAFIERLINLEVPAECGVVAPMITVGYTNVNQNPYLERRPSRLRIRFMLFVLKYYVVYLLYASASLAKKTLRAAWSVNIEVKQTRKSIYAAHGAFMIFRDTYFKRGGSFRFGAFLFCEEIHVAEEARRVGLTVMYDTSLRVRHHEHLTTGSVKSPGLQRHLYDSMLYCRNVFFSRSH